MRFCCIEVNDFARELILFLFKFTDLQPHLVVFIIVYGSVAKKIASPAVAAVLSINSIFASSQVVFAI